MKFSYKSFSPEVVRPVIPIKISYKGQSIRYEVLVDSGADFCIFDAQIGEILGIDIESGKREIVGGITGVVENYYTHPVSLAVGDYQYKTEVGFLPNIAELGYGVVGQVGFFDEFVVKFDFSDKEIELVPKNLK